MEDRLRAMLGFIEKMQATTLQEAKEIPYGYEKGVKTGYAGAFKLVNLWLRRDVLKESKASAETEVKS